MSQITVTATVHRNPKGFFEDVVVISIAGILFQTRCTSPEQAREVALRAARELGVGGE